METKSIQVNQDQDNNSDTFLRALSKTLASLFIVSTTLIVALFFLVLFILLVSVVLANPTKLAMDTVSISEMFEGIWQLIGLTCYLSAFGVPVILVCVGSFGFPLGIIGWRLNLISKKVCVFVGFLVGIIPSGLFQMNSYANVFSLSYASGIHSWMDVIRILAGFIVQITIVFVMGIFGGLGGYIFWFIWSLLTPKKSHL